MDKKSKLAYYFLLGLCFLFPIFTIFYYVWVLVLNTSRIEKIFASIIFLFLFLMVYLLYFIVQKKYILPLEDVQHRDLLFKIISCLIKASCVIGVSSIIIALFRNN